MFASLNIPLSLVEKEEFIDVIMEANHRLMLPGRFKLTRNISVLFDKMKNGIREALDEPRKIAICCDIWSRRNFMSSYLAITGHFYSSKDHCLRKVLLGLKTIEGLHTAENLHKIVCELLEEWNISNTKLSRILTDNGTNMIKLFKNAKEFVQFAESNFPSDEPIRYPAFGLEDSDREDDILDEIEMSREYDEIEERFNEHFGKNLRLSCCAHVMQRVLCDTVEKVQEWRDLMTKIRNTVKKFSRSTTGIQKLMRQTGYALVRPSATRWNVMYFVAQRLLEVKNDVIKICQEQNWDCLIASEWNRVCV